MKLVIFLFLGLFIYNVLMVGAPELKIGLLVGGLIGAGAGTQKGLRNE